MTEALTPDTQAAKPAGTNNALTGWVLPIVVNIVLPMVTYFVLTGAGMAEVPALLISGVWPVLEIAVTVRRERHVDEFSIFVLLGLVAGIVTTLISNDARDVFLKDSITTGVIGLVFLVTLLFGKPLTFYLGRRFATDGSPVQRDWWDGLWVHPQFRSLQRRLAAAWGCALLGEAVVRALLTWQLGSSAMVVVNNVVPYAVIAAMVAVSVTVGRRAQARADRAGHAGVTTPPRSA